jgi:Flp pilus assembly protein TadD
MAAARCNKYFVTALLSLSAACLCAQQTSSAVHRHPVAGQPASNSSALLDQAEALLAKRDYASALPLLRQATETDARSYQAWYDLGYAEQGLNHDTEAVAAYKRSLEINPKVFETNLDLGLLLAGSGDSEHAISYLQAATQLQPANHPDASRARAWLAVGRLQLNRNPAAAEQAFLEAAKLAPAEPQAHLLLGELYANSGKMEQATNQYQLALSGGQTDVRAQALRGLVNIAIATKHYGEAESNVRQYLATSPVDVQARLLLGHLLAAQGKSEEALTQLNAAGAGDDTVLRERADLLTALHREAEAIPIYQHLVEHRGNDAQLRYEYGLALLHRKQWAPAEEQLLAAVKLNPNLGGAYGDLAVAADENQHYDLSLKALDIRTKLLGDNPGTYFLRATALDHLRRYPEATQNYRQFLAAANGKYPDEEWKARHRLIAIQKLK